jgi:ribonuclease P protein component
LKVRSDFDRVFQTGKRLRCGPFSLVLREEPGVYRVGFKLGKKIGKAVTRNRLRRRFRSCFDLLCPKAGKGADIVVLASPGATRLSFASLFRRVEKALRRIGFRARLEDHGE